MATEIVTLKVNDRFTPDLFQKSIDYLRPAPPGFRSQGWGRTLDDPNTVIWILSTIFVIVIWTFPVDNVLDWDSVKAHENFMEAPVYPAFVATIKAFSSAPISILHTYLQPVPSSETVQTGAIEITIATREPGISSELLEMANRKHIALLQNLPGYRSHFQGVTVEDDNVNVSVVSWESTEAMKVRVIRTDWINETLLILSHCWGCKSVATCNTKSHCPRGGVCASRNADRASIIVFVTCSPHFKYLIAAYVFPCTKRLSTDLLLNFCSNISTQDVDPVFVYFNQTTSIYPQWLTEAPPVDAFLSAL